MVFFWPTSFCQNLIFTCLPDCWTIELYDIVFIVLIYYFAKGYHYVCRKFEV